jgi:predicted DNA-binding transcriptional regulator
LNEEKIETTLKGNTLRVYWYLLGKSDGIAGARELQRALGFSSPALAVYHLDKLADVGLIENTNAGYQLIKTVNVGVLKQFIRFGTFMLPRFFLYATMFTTLTIFYLTQFGRLNFYSVFGLVLALLVTAIMWYETLRAWRQKP